MREGIKLVGTHLRHIRQAFLAASVGVKANLFHTRRLLALSLESLRDSLLLGDSMLSQIKGVGRLHKAQVERANFAVLRLTDMPAVLVECAFITSSADIAVLMDEDGQNRIARAVADGLLNWADIAGIACVEDS